MKSNPDLRPYAHNAHLIGYNPASLQVLLALEPGRISYCSTRGSGRRTMSKDLTYYFCWSKAYAAIALAAATAGCMTVQGGPNRLYEVADEVAQARELLEGSERVRSLVSQYYSIPAKPSADSERMLLRNEIVARRMYIIDVQYSEYEADLTGERQKFGFATTAAATGLGIASSLATPVRSAQILSGVGAGFLAARGAYDSEVVIAKTLQIVQGYMRAARDDVASRQILPRLNDSTVAYPLSAALHDLEDYYRAGTFTAGLIPALRESGGAAQKAAAEKAALKGTFGSDDATSVLRRYLAPEGALDRTRLTLINSCLAQRFQITTDIRRHILRQESGLIRANAVLCARTDPRFTG